MVSLEVVLHPNDWYVIHSQGRDNGSQFVLGRERKECFLNVESRIERPFDIDYGYGRAHWRTLVPRNPSIPNARRASDLESAVCQRRRNIQSSRTGLSPERREMY
jgi:hypothetical protein